MADSAQRFSEISTHWSLIFRAHAAENPTAAAAARADLLARYGEAVYRFLLNKVRDEDAAAELCQEFALRLVRGDFRRAHPDRGHFRALLQTALANLITDDHRRRAARHRPLSPDSPFFADLPAAESAEDGFAPFWRDELLAQAWDGLARHQTEQGGMQYTVLRGRADHPDLSSAELAAVLSERLGQPLRAEAVRQTLRRARAKFAELLRVEVGRSLETDEPTLVDSELAELGLLAYCLPNSSSPATTD